MTKTVWRDEHNGRQALEGTGKRERPTEKAGGGLKFG